jgi:hypothetical protein
MLRVLSQRAPCRGCDAEIYWVTTKNGKKMPMNHDGIPHWKTCPKAKDFRKPKRDRPEDREEIPY